jgi:hypothetical protein
MAAVCVEIRPRNDITITTTTFAKNLHVHLIGYPSEQIPKTITGTLLRLVITYHLSLALTEEAGLQSGNVRGTSRFR